jgi:hypothetical protein
MTERMDLGGLPGISEKKRILAATHTPLTETPQQLKGVRLVRGKKVE